MKKITVTITKTEAKPGFKHTAVGWIPMDWEVKSLAQLTTLVTNGFVGRATEHYSDSANAVLYVQGYNVKENSFNLNGIRKVTPEFHLDNQKSCLKEGDLLTIQTGDVGVTALVPKSLQGSNCHALVISRFEKPIADPKFYVQYYNSWQGRLGLKRIETGSTMKHLNVTDLVNWMLPVPPPPEQRAIAAILSTWDTAIAKTQQLIALKEQRKKALMQQLLTGKKRLPGFNGKWNKLHIAAIAEELSIRNTKDKRLTVLSCTKHNGLVPSLEYFGRKIFSDDLSTYKIVPMNTFAYATNHIEEGSIGYQSRYDEALISPMYTVFKTIGMDDRFVFALLKTHSYIHEYQRRMEGSIDRRGGLRWEEFSKIKAPVPDINEQTAIATVLGTADNELNLLRQKLDVLNEQKKGLMQKLLTGQIRVKVKS